MTVSIKELLVSVFVIPLCFNTASAREPAAHVVEITSAAAPHELCSDIRFKGGSFLISRGLYLNIRNSDLPGWIKLEPGVEHFEDVSEVIIVRKNDGCIVRLSGSEPPSIPEIIVTQGVNSWKFDTDGGLGLRLGELEITLQENNPLHFNADENSDSKDGTVIYNYGILSTGTEIIEPETEEVTIDDSVSGKFSGPGDNRIYTLSLEQPGMLVVEYRRNGDSVDTDIAIKDDDGEVKGTGGAYFDKPGDAVVELTYRGWGQSEFDVGFLFSPHSPFECDIKLKRENGRYKAELILKNTAYKSVMGYKPDSGTVTWFSGDEMIAGANPGRPPVEFVYNPGETVIYDTERYIPENAKTLEAEIRISDYVINCTEQLSEEKE